MMRAAVADTGKPGGISSGHIMRVIVLFGILLALAACGGSNRSDVRGAPTRGFATGEISRACIAADRDRASPQLCGCIQSVANQTLSQRDRSRVATFFADPEVAHATKISDTRADDAFWDRYRNFIDASRGICG